MERDGDARALGQRMGIAQKPPAGDGPQPRGSASIYFAVRGWRGEKKSRSALA